MQREMKDSGIEWIGEIPSDWSIGRIKYNFYLKGRIGWQGLKANEFIDDGPFLVTGTDFENGSVNWSTCYHISEERYMEAPEIHVENGDLLITKDGTVGKVAYINNKPEKVSLNSHLLIIRPSNQLYCNKFLFWVIQSPVFDKYFLLSQNGTIMASLSQEKINNFSFPLPSIETQQHIATYLDRKCSQIDAIIARQQEVIEKLKAYKLSVISEAVTKGLDPNVPMKDSGVEWIGEIPKNWETSKLKFMGHFVNGYAFPSSSFTDDGVRVMKIANIQPMEISWTDESYVDVSEYDKLPMYRVEQGDLVFALTRPIINGGIKVAIFDGKEKVLLNQRNAMFKGLSRVLPLWMYYVMQNQMYVQKFALYIDGTGQQPNISTNEISEIEIPVPPIEVQKQIIIKLNEVMASIEKLVSLKEQVIKKLTDYKKSLIYEVVTGKQCDWNV